MKAQQAIAFLTSGFTMNFFNTHIVCLLIDFAGVWPRLTGLKKGH